MCTSVCQFFPCNIAFILLDLSNVLISISINPSKLLISRTNTFICIILTLFEMTTKMDDLNRCSFPSYLSKLRYCSRITCMWANAGLSSTTCGRDMWQLDKALEGCRPPPVAVPLPAVTWTLRPRPRYPHKYQINYYIIVQIPMKIVSSH